MDFSVNNCGLRLADLDGPGWEPKQFVGKTIASFRNLDRSYL